MRGFALVIVLMGLAAASAMADVEKEGQEDFDWIADEQLVETNREAQLGDYRCPACKVHLTAMLTTKYFDQLLHEYCSTVPRVPARSGRARARCFHLANSGEALNMVTPELVYTLCKNGNRCP